MRLKGVASVLVDQLPPASDAPPAAERLGLDILKNYTELERVTYVSDLVVAGARPEHLEQQPLPVLILGVRGDNGEPFGYHVLKALNPHYTMAQFLASPLGEQLTPELIEFMRLTHAELRSLNACEVRQLGWPLSRWHLLFGVGVNFFTELGMKTRDLCIGAEEALATALLPDEEGSEPLFKIEL